MLRRVPAAFLVAGLLAAGPVLPQERSRTFGDSVFDASVFSLVALHIADYYTTREALRYPGNQEANPWLKSITKVPAAFAIFKAGISAGTYFGLKSIYEKNKTLGWMISTFSNFGLSYIVFHNLKAIREARAR